MTTALPTATPEAPSPLSDDARPSEPFIAVTLRRLRYLVAIGISAALFVTLGYAIAHPPADSSGVLFGWHGAMGGPLVGMLLLTLLMAVATAVSTFICHPDAPHAGLWCAMLGLGALAIRGGTVRQVLFQAEYAGKMPDFYHALALECAGWALLIIVAEITARAIWGRFLANTHWIGRNGVDAPTLPTGSFGMFAGMVHLAHNIGSARDRSTVSGSLSARLIDSGVALAVTGGVAYALLAVFLQSQAKGQVLVSGFLCFALAALLARLLSPKSDALAFLLAVPLTAAVGYLLSESGVSIKDGMVLLHGAAPPPGTLLFPGYSVTPAGRALPIDFIAGGVPGAILGYYSAVRMQFHSAQEKLLNESKT